MSTIESGKFGRKGLKPPERTVDESLQRHTPREILGILHGRGKLPELNRWEEIQAHGFSGRLDDNKIIEGLKKDIREKVRTLVGGGREQEITRKIITGYVAQERLDKG